MRAYAEHRGCRRAFVLGYFGEGYPAPCGRCDWCEDHPGDTGDAHAAIAGAPGIGARVRHRTWGEGTVSGIDDGQVTIVFDGVGYKTLDTGIVSARGLVESV